MKRLLAALSVLVGAVAAQGAPLKITDAILALPGVATGIADLCEQVCAGNEKRSWLESATLDENGSLALELRLRNKHVPVKGVVLYDDTAHVTATARVQLLSCSVSDWDVKSNNDIYDIALDLFRDRIGGEIANLEGRCREFFGR